MINYFEVISYSRDQDNDTWSTTPIVITEAFDVDVTINEGDTNDSCNFSVPNTNNLSINSFNREDKIVVHLLQESETSSDDNIIFVGLIKQVSESLKKSCVLDIQCNSFGEILSTGLVFNNTSNVNSMEYIQSCLDSIRRYSDTFAITWNADNPTIKRDGITAFPKINGGGIVSDKDVSFNSIITKYLTDKYMADGKYYWYVNVSNELVIRPIVNVFTNTITEGVDIISAKYGLDPKIYNYVIVKCGLDSKGSNITTKAVDYVSMAKYGFKYYMLVNSNIASDLFASDGVEQGSYPTSYPHTCSWKDENGDVVTASGDADYRNKFRAQAKVAGTSYGMDWISKNSNLSRKFTIELFPNRDYTIGNVIKIIAPSYNISGLNMRVISVQYSLINTVITLKEDVNI